MTRLLFIIGLLFTTSIGYSQNTELKKTNVKGDLTEVSLFYETGALMQHGFYTKEGKLHGSWESYNIDGSIKCYATYNNGIKVGIWTYWYADKISKVEYQNNKIINIVEVKRDERVKNNY
jgi:antitoxin component YwqK of YwqJK toxin-antitoxin module